MLAWVEQVNLTYAPFDQYAMAFIWRHIIRKETQKLLHNGSCITFYLWRIKIVWVQSSYEVLVQTYCIIDDHYACVGLHCILCNFIHQFTSGHFFFKWRFCPVTSENPHGHFFESLRGCQHLLFIKNITTREAVMYHMKHSSSSMLKYFHLFTAALFHSLLQLVTCNFMLY